MNQVAQKKTTEVVVSELDKMLEKALKNFKPIIDSNAEVVEESKE